MAKQFVKELRPGNVVSSEFQISSPAVRQAKNGSNYLMCKLADRSGSVEARLWSYSPSALLADGAVLEIKGVVEEYQGKAQVVISTFAPRTSITDEDFIKSSKYVIQTMWDNLVGMLATIENDWIRVVAEDLLLHDVWAPAFQRSPAASGMHHAFVGGLLEHTWQMVESGDTLLKLPYYKEVLNRDLCLFGLMFHDFGKIFEYESGAGFKRAVQGLLVPHIPMTAALILEAANMRDVPEIVRDHMMHVVLAHHGQIEWGSPVSMNIPEAGFVHYIDNLHGSIFGWVQRIENEALPGNPSVKNYVGKNELVVERFSAILKKCGEARSAEEVEGF